MKETKFKQTEIGKIPEDWKVVRLGDVSIKIGSGLTPRGGKKVYTDSGIALIRSQNIYNEGFKKEGLVFIDEEHSKDLDNVVVEEGDVLLNITGDSVARCCIVPTEILPARVNQHVSIIRPNPDILDPCFLRYYLITKRMQKYMLSLADSGGTRKALTKGMIEDFIVPKPDLNEQKAIAKILSSLDDKIELNQRMNKTLEAIAQAIFKRWFIDFEFPNEEGKPYKSSGGEMVYNEKLGKEIPKGWEVKPLDKIAHFLNGLALQKYPPENEEDYLPVIKIRELRQGITESSDKASPNIPKEYIVHDGDVLFSWSGSLEVKIWCGGKGALNQHLFKVTSDEYPKWFYYFWIKKHLPFFRRIAEDKATTMGHIKRQHLSESLVIIPERSIMEKGNTLMNPLFENYITNSIENRNLAKIRDTLLPKLMSGEIRVKVDEVRNDTGDKKDEERGEG
ncbi:MAG TPA: restriction endonuclease subunit S [Thermoplasmata archaeon]|nr:restriction endonuclease subunit S [Thermoplasmata archaeon]